MASTTIYPPIVNDYEPAFVAGDDAKLRMYFNLSSLSGEVPEGFYIHAQIIRKDGVQVVNLENDSEHDLYRATGTILNLMPFRVSTGYYYVDIDNSNLKSIATFDGVTFEGWIPGWIYKIQLRISTVRYPGTGMQEAWLQENSANFSEWSTICFVKAISEMEVNVEGFTAGTSPVFPEANSRIFKGSIFSSIIDANEDYYSCNLSLYAVDNNNQLISVPLEVSGDIFNDEVSPSAFYYTFKTEFINGQKYIIYFNYITENDYQPPASLQYPFTFVESASGTTKVRIITIDNDIEPGTEEHPVHILNDITTLGMEEDEGRIGLKLYFYDPDPDPELGADTDDDYSQFLIRRSSSKDNFKTWTDLLYINVGSNTEEDIDAYPIVYDYTAESGVWYKYGIAGVTNEGVRSSLNITDPIIRIYEYSYLLGTENQQLKLQFDNTISNYSIKVTDTAIETIGSKYPFMDRNSNIYYRTFPITGLITFWMDEENTFLKDGMSSVYDPAVATLYENYNIERGIRQYNYTYERDFRNKVNEFLHDGKYKLFKSPTEGNIIIRLKDISLTPNQSLDRLIYSFNATAVEMDDNTMYNYLKYGFYYPGTYSTEA